MVLAMEAREDFRSLRLLCLSCNRRSGFSTHRVFEFCTPVEVGMDVVVS